MSIRDVDRGWKRIQRELLRIDALSVTVGVQSDAGSEANGMTLAGVAAINEFGAEWTCTGKQAYYITRVLMGIDAEKDPGRFWGVFRKLKGKRMKIPARSFLGSTFDQDAGKFQIAAERILNNIIDGRYGAEDGLKRFGEGVQARVQQRMRSNLPPPNAPLTVFLKGDNKTLIGKSGRLIQSVRYVVKRR